MNTQRRYSRPPSPHGTHARTAIDSSAQRRSLAVPLVLAGTLGFALLQHSGTDVQRNRYKSLQDCTSDYSLQQCNSDTPLSGNGGTSYYGPWYRSRGSSSTQDASDPGPGRSGGFGAAHAFGEAGPSGVELGSRGGFGRSGRISARGG
jgi:hypothetical protein